MKPRNFLAVVLLCTVVALGASSASANLLVNGDFEEPSPTGWEGGFNTYSLTNSVYYSGNAPADTGDAYGWAWGETTFGSASQTVDVSAYAGSEFEFSAWMSAYYGNDDFAIITLDFLDSSDALLSSIEFNGNDGQNPYIVGSANEQGEADSSVAWSYDNWSLYKVRDFIAEDAVSAIVTIESSAVNSNGNDAYVDGVSLAIVPEPATMLLVAAGGLLISRRKRN